MHILPKNMDGGTLNAININKANAFKSVDNENVSLVALVWTNIKNSLEVSEV